MLFWATGQNDVVSTKLKLHHINHNITMLVPHSLTVLATPAGHAPIDRQNHPSGDHMGEAGCGRARISALKGGQ